MPQPSQDKLYPHNDQPHLNLNQDAWRHPPPTDAEVAQMAEDEWRATTLWGYSVESVFMFDVWDYILGGEQMATPSTSSGYVLSSEEQAAVGHGHILSDSMSATTVTTTPSQARALYGQRIIPTSYEGVPPQPPLEPAPFNTPPLPTPFNTPEKPPRDSTAPGSSVQMHFDEREPSAYSAGSTVQQVYTDRRIPRYEIPLTFSLFFLECRHCTG